VNAIHETLGERRDRHSPQHRQVSVAVALKLERELLWEQNAAEELALAGRKAGAEHYTLALLVVLVYSSGGGPRVEKGGLVLLSRCGLSDVARSDRCFLVNRHRLTRQRRFIDRTGPREQQDICTNEALADHDNVSWNQLRFVHFQGCRVAQDLNGSVAAHETAKPVAVGHFRVDFVRQGGRGHDHDHDRVLGVVFEEPNDRAEDLEDVERMHQLDKEQLGHTWLVDGDAVRPKEFAPGSNNPVIQARVAASSELP